MQAAALDRYTVSISQLSTHPRPRGNLPRIGTETSASSDRSRSPYMCMAAPQPHMCGCICPNLPKIVPQTFLNFFVHTKQQQQQQVETQGLGQGAYGEGKKTGQSTYSVHEHVAAGDDDVLASEVSRASHDLGKLRSLRALALKVHYRNSCKKDQASPQQGRVSTTKNGACTCTMTPHSHHIHTIVSARLCTALLPAGPPHIKHHPLPSARCAAIAAMRYAKKQKMRTRQQRSGIILPARTRAHPTASVAATRRVADEPSR